MKRESAANVLDINEKTDETQQFHATQQGTEEAGRLLLCPPPIMTCLLHASAIICINPEGAVDLHGFSHHPSFTFLFTFI